MAHRNIHYEAAFENYLRSKGWPYVAIDESQRTLFAGASVKSFDYLVYSESGPNMLVDVKGRKFPDGVVGRRRGNMRAWENWITHDDVTGLREWQKVFGRDFVATLVFAYWLQGPPQRAPFEDVHLFRENHYGFVAISLEDYVSGAQPRSAKWQTIAMPSKVFSAQAQDVATFL